MSIVVITIPGGERRDFANSLHKKTGCVELVIIQKSKIFNESFTESIGRLKRAVGLPALPRELFYALLLRFNKPAQKVLEYFRNFGDVETEKTYLTKTIEVSSVNSPEVLEILKKIKPKILVVWGNTILKKDILATAEKVLNLHMGLCPYYRGSVANQYALINDEPNRLGATIHYVKEGVDTGDVIETLSADISKRPRDLFLELNKKAKELYLEIIQKLYKGGNLPRIAQDPSVGKNYMLRDWTPSVRYKLAKKILNWEKRGGLT
ncbi:MAG: formyltransferase family protein [Patescibacteria group bacterium]